MKSRISNLVSTLLILLGSIVAGSTRGQEHKKISPEWVYSEEAEAIFSVPSFKWLDDGTLLLYDKRIDKAQQTFERLDPKSGRRESILDMPKALAGIRSLLADQDTLSVLSWPEACDGLGKHAVYMFDDDIFLLDFSSAAFHRVTQTKAEEKCVRFSPNGQCLGFVRDNDLYLYDIARESERRLTSGGSDTTLNGTLPWLYWEEIFGRSDDGYWWSSDSRNIAFLQTEQAHVDTMSYVVFEDFHPSVEKQFYPRAGDPNPVVKLGMVSVDGGAIVWADFPEDSFEYIVDATWLPGGKRVAVQTMNRAQDQLDLHLVNRTDGSVEHAMTETDSAWVNPCKPYYLSDEKHFVWLSERDGFAHLYLYTGDGSLTNRITAGEWAVFPSISFSRGGLSAPFAVDEQHGWIYFIATEKAPVERHLYRARLDGSSLQRLSQDAGSHKVNFSPDLRYYVDEHSSLSTLPALSLYRSDGTLVSTLAAPRPELLSPYDVQYPDLMTFPASDGLSLPCMITKPANFDPTRKYPAILQVYGGPASPSVVNAWGGVSPLYNQMYLDMGYLVVSFDNRSAATISRRQSSKIKGQLWGEIELNDLVAFVNWLKQQPYVDAERLGIWGWSGGGTYTLLAMTHTKEFKAGIAGAPVTDWRYYDTKYTEAVMRKPVDNPDGYKSTSLVDRAADLHGRLLLIHGTSDDNVNIQNTWAFAEKLIDSGKMFDIMVYPLQKHDFEDKHAKIHRLKKMVEFWSKNL